MSFEGWTVVRSDRKISIKCYGCGKVGHRVRDCKDNCKNESGGSKAYIRRCYGCGEVGYKMKNCRNGCQNYFLEKPQSERDKIFKSITYLDKPYVCRKCYFRYDDSYGECECY